MNYYYTTPIFYVNDKPHIGHAYSTVLCDFLARYAVLGQHNCIWSTGTDEHGQKIASSAQKANQNPQDYVDEISRHFFTMCNKLSCSQFIFNRTTSAKHIRAVDKVWGLLLDSGYIYQGKYAGWYAVRDEAFYTDAEVDNGIAVATGASVEWIEENAYFFKLSAMAEQLLEFYDANPDFIYPASRYNEVKSFVHSGLKDISVSRAKGRVSWGIPVPGDPTQTIYVWLDALTTYISSLDFDQTASKAFQDFWQNPNAMVTHIIGKDILRFHAVYWPAFLMAAKLPLPKCIIAHGWWTNEGQKISKSLGNTIDPVELVQHFGTEYLRYFVLREVPIGLDGNFSKENLITRVNAELADNIGNLIQRTWSMIYKYDLQFHEIVFDENLIANGYQLVAEAKKRAEQYDISGYLECILSISSSANAYIAAQKPWALAKNQQIAPLLMILMSVVELVRLIAVLLEPVMPAAAKKIFAILNIAPEFCTLRYLTRQYAIQHKPLQATELIFPRIISQPEVSNDTENAV